MVDETSRAQPAQPEQVNRERRRLFCGLAASGSLLLAIPHAQAAGEPVPLDPASEVGTVWWSELATRNMPKAVSFYCDVIGWTAKAGDIADGTRPTESSYTLLVANGNDVAGAKAIGAEGDATPKTPMWVTYFQVDNVDAALSRALAAGGSVITSPFNVDGVARMAIIADPEGNAVGIANPL